MANAPVHPSDLKRHLVNGCGYQPGLIVEDYAFAANKTIGLAAFAHQPFDARSACIAAIDCRSVDPLPAVMA